MSNSKIPRGQFRNPHPDLKNAAAKTAVDSLLATVKEAHERFGDPKERDYEIASMPLWVVQEMKLYENLTITEVVKAHIRLTIKASLETHCLTAFPYEKALEDARFHDEDYDDDDPKAITDYYPLIGLVFSVKDCIHVEGLPTTLGCSLRAGHNEAATADLVQKLINAGAIMIAKTTAPQLMMSNTTHSPLWGTTRSPIQSAQEGEGEKDEFQVGGSSGGEASLVKIGGSMLGVGTDMGGSIRQPACLNELIGFKFASTSNPFRWNLPQDFMTGLPHTTVPATAPGLIARDLETLKLTAEHLYGGKYANVKELTEDDWDHVYKGDPSPVPEDLGNNPRIVYTTQQCSSEVEQLVKWLVHHLETNGDMLMRPSKCDKLGEIDVKAWGEAWMEHATEHGFDDARAMLADDPLITRTMFDEERLDATAAKKRQWKADTCKLDRLKETFLRQAAVGQFAKKDDDDDAADDDDDEDDSDDSSASSGVENVIFITPTYVLGTPVQNSALIALDDARESEIWCQIFNLLDWPCISFPIPLPSNLRAKFRDAATSSPTWAKHLPGLIEADPIDEDGEPRLPFLSLQLATLPGNQLALLDYVARIENLRSK